VHWCCRPARRFPAHHRAFFTGAFREPLATGTVSHAVPGSAAGCPVHGHYVRPVNFTRTASFDRPRDVGPNDRACFPAIAEADEMHAIDTIWGPQCFTRRMQKHTQDHIKKLFR
jgi:hypothetical protein